jgi:excinuclease ABC subunit A
VIIVEHDMRVVAGCDWVIDIGPGAGEEGGHLVATGKPAEVARATHSRTAPYLARFLADASRDAVARRAHDRGRSSAG